MAAVRLTVLDTQAEAEILCSLLRTERIPCEHRPAYFAASVRTRAASRWTEVLVDEADLERARGRLPEPQRGDQGASRPRLWHIALVLLVVAALLVLALWRSGGIAGAGQASARINKVLTAFEGVS
jgi:hypothetical protein